MPETDFTQDDAIGWQFENWWGENWPNGFANFLQAKDYAEAAYRAGYKAMREIVMSNSASPVPEPKMQELLTRDQRDALCATNVLVAQMQNSADGVYRQRLQKIMNVISDMLYA